MGIGLGRNSPVKLSLSKDNYCALIERHGQWIRWRTAQKCACINKNSMQPDVHCKICGGRGVIYSFQKDQVIFEIVMVKDSSGLIEISEDHKDCELIEVYDINGKRFPNAEKIDSFIYLNTDEQLQKGVYYTVILRQKTTKYIESEIAKKEDSGYWSVPGLTSARANVEGVYYSVNGDLSSINKVIDANNVEYTVKELRLNQFLIDPKTDEEGNEIEIAEPLTVEGIEYIPPFIFAMLNQNLSETDARMVEDVQGDAVLIYPYELDVAEDDVLTVLAGSYTKKEVINRTSYKTDTLGVYFVYDVVSCMGMYEGELVEFKEGEDFILVGTNKIKWLDEDYQPDADEGYSITYHVLPTYKVIKNIPQLRTSENQRFPKKAIVKFMQTYSESIGANKQDVKAKGRSGSY